MKPLVSIDNLSISYKTGFFNRTFFALKEITLSFYPGQLIAIRGSNGAGKSTLLKTIAGFIPTQQVIRTHVPIGYVPEHGYPPLSLTVYQFLWYCAQISGDPDTIEYVLEQCNLTNKIHQKIGSLSHGMRRRVIIAQAYVSNPSLILLDEPFTGLDIESLEIVRSFCFAKRPNCTIVYTTHKEIIEDTDQIVELKNENI